MNADLARALRTVERRQARLDDAIGEAQEQLTLYFESHLQELAKRFPKRKFHASSGMGSLSVEISGNLINAFETMAAGMDYYWIWNSHHSATHNPVFAKLARAWEALLDEFSDRSGQTCVNFTRDITVYGEHYQGDRDNG